MHEQKSIAIKHAFVTNGVTRALKRYSSGLEMDELAKEALIRGADLLFEMRRGIAITDPSPSENLFYSSESIFAADLALSVAGHLSTPIGDAKDLMIALSKWEDILRSISTDDPLAPDSIGPISNMFELLSAEVMDEVTAS